MGISSVNSGSSNALSSTSQQAQQAQSLLASLQSQPTLFDVLSEGGSGSSSDILDLSSAGQSAADQIDTMLESALMSRTQSVAQESSASLHEGLGEVLAGLGIDISQQIDLQVDAKGNVVVTNNNAQKDAIEAAINNDAELKKKVTEYFSFLESAASTLSSSGSQSDSNSYISQLWAQFGGNPNRDTSASTDSTDAGEPTVTLRMKGDAFQVDYQTGDGDLARILAASS